MAIAFERLQDLPPRFLAPLPSSTSEKLWQQWVTDLARLLGYLVYHTYRSTRSAPGFPDLTIVGHGRVLFAELKTNRGKTTAEQETWLAALRKTGQPVYVWRPRDAERVARELFAWAVPHAA